MEPKNKFTKTYMKIIYTKKNDKILVDDEDYESLNTFIWRIEDGNGYPRNNRIYMHRLLLNIPRGKYGDHIDGNKLNNQKSNLRMCTNAQNGLNRDKPVNNTSGFKGVYWHSYAKKWQAKTTLLGKKYHLGFFESKREAARSYNKFSIENHKGFGRLNQC